MPSLRDWPPAWLWTRAHRYDVFACVVDMAFLCLFGADVPMKSVKKSFFSTQLSAAARKAPILCISRECSDRFTWSGLFTRSSPSTSVWGDGPNPHPRTPGPWECGPLGVMLRPPGVTMAGTVRQCLVMGWWPCATVWDRTDPCCGQAMKLYVCRVERVSACYVVYVCGVGCCQAKLGPTGALITTHAESMKPPGLTNQTRQPSCGASIPCQASGVNICNVRHPNLTPSSHLTSPHQHPPNQSQ